VPEFAKIFSRHRLTEDEVVISDLLPVMLSFDSTLKETDSSSHTETLTFVTSGKYSSEKRHF
jgi:hypothetical protein